MLIRCFRLKDRFTQSDPPEKPVLLTQKPILVASRIIASKNRGRQLGHKRDAEKPRPCVAARLINAARRHVALIGRYAVAVATVSKKWITVPHVPHVPLKWQLSL